MFITDFDHEIPAYIRITLNKVYQVKTRTYMKITENISNPSARKKNVFPLLDFIKIKLRISESHSDGKGHLKTDPESMGHETLEVLQKKRTYFVSAAYDSYPEKSLQEK